MKVKELIELLQQQDPGKEVMMQQGEDYDYVPAEKMCEIELIDSNNDTTIKAVVIQYE